MDTKKEETAADAQTKLKEEINKAIKSIDNIKDKVKVVAINHILDKKKKLDEQHEKEMKALQIKYDKLSQPLISDQNKLIAGQRAVTDEELTKANEFLNEEEQKQLPTVVSNTDQISEYWLKVLRNSDVVGNEILEKDEDVLKHLIKIEYNLIENTDNFEIEFHFSQNEYFNNEVLKKTFYLKEDDEIDRTDGTDIDWKKGKNLTVKTVKKTQKNKKSGAKRVVTKEVEDESFFNFFKSAAGVEEEADPEDEEAYKAEERLNIDFDIGRNLIDEIIPYSLEYYLDVKEKEDDQDDEGDDGEGGFEDVDKGDDDNDDDDEEDEKPAKNKKKKQHKKSSDSQGDKGGAKGEGKPQECKQQ